MYRTVAQRIYVQSLALILGLSLFNTNSGFSQTQQGQNRNQEKTAEEQVHEAIETFYEGLRIGLRHFNKTVRRFVLGFPEEKLTERKILWVTAEAMPKSHYEASLLIKADGTLYGLVFRVFERLDSGEGKLKKELFFSEADVAKGAVIKRTDDGDTEILTLFTTEGKFDSKEGGQLYVKYLYEGGILSSTYYNFDFEIRRQGGEWMLFEESSGQRKRFNNLHLVTHRKWKLGKVRELGIKEVVPSYK